MLISNLKTKKMKKHLKYIIGLLSCALIVSCNDYLDVQPETSYLEEDVFTREAGIQTVLNGIYTNMTQGSTYGGNLTMSTVEIFGQQFDLSELDHVWEQYGKYDYEDASVQGNVDAIWSNTYINILNINNFIAGLDTYPDIISTEKENLLKGEAIALRAMLHFDMLRLFGPVYSEFPTELAIPYNVEAKANLTPILPANEVMVHILNDLSTAEQLLANDPIIEYGKIAVLEEDADDLDENDPAYGFEGPDFYRFRNLRLNYYAVKALQARVHLYAGNTVEANNAAQYVIDEASKHFEWINPVDIIGSNPDRIFYPEIIFGIQNRKIEDRHDNYFIDDLNIKSILVANPSQLEADVFENNQNDYRYNSTWILPNTGSKSFRTFYKYANITSDQQFMQPLIKMSEMYYIVAETSVDNATALLYLNSVRFNRGLVDVEIGVVVKDEITKEFRREFYGEGQLFFYYKRNNFLAIPNGSSDSGTIPMNNSKYIVPLPLSETDYRQ